MSVFGRRTARKLAQDMVVLVLSLWAAFLLRHDWQLSSDARALLISSWPLVLTFQIAFLALFGVPRQTWRFVGLHDLQRLVSALALATLSLALLTSSWVGFFPRIPVSILVIDLVLSLLATSGLRIAARKREHRRAAGTSPGTNRIPTVLIGAGKLGALLAREIASDPGCHIYAVGFIDDDIKIRGTVIHGVPVLAGIDELEQVIRDHQVRQVLIAISGASAEMIRGITDRCAKFGITAKIVPAPLDVVTGKIARQIREVAIEDILGRNPVDLDDPAIGTTIRGRTIMVTGAGGSIGSELCRNICRYSPAALLLLERAENNLFHVHRELSANFSAIALIPCLADIGDKDRLNRIFALHRPEVVFHAAAHKHVPMMEINPGEAIKNNVIGTRHLVDLAHQHGVERFVTISTDKAINPSSVMGASKRVAEMYIQSISARGKTHFLTVRFGNVLDSSGNVIGIFKEQIARGGPVTVTHPDMCRFFMTAKEACQLVLQTATMGEGGETFILDMGQPVKIVDLARDMIHLSGLSTEEVEIQFVGVRPGEKLFEELSFDAEKMSHTRHPKIFTVHQEGCSWERINRMIDELAGLVDSDNDDKIIEKIREIVPEYSPPSPLDHGDSPAATAQRPSHAIPIVKGGSQKSQCFV